MRTIGIGLIGSGFMGKCHTLAYRAVNGVFDMPVRPALEVLADVTPEVAAAAAPRLGFSRSTGQWRDLLTDPTVQVIDICTPPATHAEIALAAVAAGKHVYCEKPVAPRAGAAREMMEAAERAGVSAVVPKPKTSNNLAEGLFDKRDFVYDAKTNGYQCPAGRSATYRFTTEEAGKTLHKHWSSDCPQCPMKPRCTKGTYRRIARWEHEDILDVVQKRLEGAPEVMRLRRQTVEHVFGTLKAWMGSCHFLTRTLPRVRTEMSLQVLAYNLKRAIKILGAGPLMAAMKA